MNEGMRLHILDCSKSNANPKRGGSIWFLAEHGQVALGMVSRQDVGSSHDLCRTARKYRWIKENECNTHTY